MENLTLGNAVGVRLKLIMDGYMNRNKLLFTGKRKIVSFLFLILCLMILYPKEAYMSGVVSCKKVTKNMLVIYAVGLRHLRGDEFKIKAATEDNERRIKAGQKRCEEIAKKAQEELKRIIKEYKFKKNIGKMPKEFDIFPYDSEEYSKYPQRVEEPNAEKFTGKECIYGFGKGIAKIFIYFKILPEKDIRVNIANRISEAIEREENTDRFDVVYHAKLGERLDVFINVLGEEEKKAVIILDKLRIRINASYLNREIYAEENGDAEKLKFKREDKEEFCMVARYKNYIIRDYLGGDHADIVGPKGVGGAKWMFKFEITLAGDK